uniref:RING-H2 finger protein ATL46-like n=1 Tax=Nicotiana sylvestris TaxID=4096 RepID=A0A1U7V1F5_NICSY|nr:PREDICTED: RING-H2 finger protein ATL46-like [Nicotiana sylvestris]
MYFDFDLLTTVTVAATTVFLICTIKLQWFRPDNHLPPPFAVEDGGYDGGRCCAVCLNDVIGGESCRKLPKCGHMFHVECVDAWLQCSWTCPLCRRQVTDQLPKQQGENTIFSYLIFRCKDFLLKIFSPFTEELMMVLIESVILPRP